MWPWLTVLVTSGAVIGGIGWDVWPRTVDLSVLRPASRAVRSAPTPAAEQISVRLFFPQEANLFLWKRGEMFLGADSSCRIPYGLWWRN